MRRLPKGSNRVPGIRYGIVMHFEKAGKHHEALYCMTRSASEAHSIGDAIRERIPTGRPFNFGWARLILEEEWLFRNMPRKSVITHFTIEEFNGPAQVLR